jgi:hypothetical protein
MKGYCFNWVFLVQCKEPINFPPMGGGLGSWDCGELGFLGGPWEVGFWVRRVWGNGAFGSWGAGSFQACLDWNNGSNSRDPWLSPDPGTGVRSLTCFSELFSSLFQLLGLLYLALCSILALAGRGLGGHSDASFHVSMFPLLLLWLLGSTFLISGPRSRKPAGLASLHNRPTPPEGCPGH